MFDTSPIIASASLGISDSDRIDDFDSSIFALSRGYVQSGTVFTKRIFEYFPPNLTAWETEHPSKSTSSASW